MPIAEPMFPGDIYDSAARVAADLAARTGTDADRVAAEMGWPISLLPEDRGGLGLGYAGLCAIAEALGAAGSPARLAGSACAVAELAAHCPQAERARLDALLAEGGIVAALGAMVEDRIAEGALSVAPRGGGVVLSGEVVGLDAAVPPAHLLLSVPINGHHALLLVTPDEAAFDTRRRMDTRPAAAARFEGAPLTPIATLPQAAVRAVETRCALVASAEALGAAFRALDLTTAYLAEREQFGTPLATFQVLRHKVVDAYVAAMVARGAVTEAVIALDAGTASDRDVALATLETRRAARHIGKEIIQLHGGIGMTDALPAAQLARRLLMLDYEYGSAAGTFATLEGAA